MTSDGTPWRPLVHGLDIARAIIAALQAPTEAIHNEVFNVGDTSHNYRVREIAEIVGEIFPDCRVSFGAPGQDNRSYRVSFEKIRKHLPGFRCAWDARRGAKQLHDLFKRIDMTKDVFEYRTFTRLKQLEYLIRTQQIDPQFFWHHRRLLAFWPSPPRSPRQPAASGAALMHSGVNTPQASYRSTVVASRTVAWSGLRPNSRLARRCRRRSQHWSSRTSRPRRRARSPSPRPCSDSAR